MKICNDCPRRCGVERPLSGKDGAVLPGFCRSPWLPVLARAGLHMWEEPVISGEKGSGAVFFSGCNLRCVYCQNYGISNRGEGEEVSVARLREIYGELIAQGALNINLVTPGHYLDAVLESLQKPLPVPVVYNSNGYDAVDSLRLLEGKIQIYLPDLKYADNALGMRYSGVKDYFETVAAAIREMFRQTGPYQIGEDGIMRSGVVIRHLLLPGQLENTRQVIRWVAENFRPGEVCFSLMRQYLPCGAVSETQYPELNRKITAGEYRAAKEMLFASGIEDGFLQSKQSAEAEFIPDFDGTGVKK